jgi:membrane protease YdiL (CAAX protease family)
MSDIISAHSGSLKTAAPSVTVPESAPELASSQQSVFTTLFRAFGATLLVGGSSFVAAMIFTFFLNIVLLPHGRTGTDISFAQVFDMIVIIAFNGALITGCLLWASHAAPAQWRQQLGFVYSPINGRVLLLMLGIMVAGAIWLEFLSSVVGKQAFESATSSISLNGGPFARLLVVFAVVVAAPAAEEIFFRGFLQQRLRRGFGPFVAIGLSTIAFAMVHYNGGMLHPLGVALLSIGCGYLRERTGSLWASILLHAINNSLVIVGLVLGL